MIYSRAGGGVRLYTRHENDVTAKYPELLSGLSDDVILDGEVAQIDPETENISFETLNNRFQLRREEKIVSAASNNPVNFITFDILQYRGKDLRSLPLMQRKEILAGLNNENPSISVIPFIEEKGIDLFRSIQ